MDVPVVKTLCSKDLAKRVLVKVFIFEHLMYDYKSASCSRHFIENSDCATSPISNMANEGASNLGKFSDFAS